MTNSFFDEYEDGMKPRYKTGMLGAPLTIQSANQIQDMGVRLNEGIKNIEISAISPEIAEGIPEEHFKEMRRLGKLTDSKVSLHAPIIDASGFTQQGWSDQNRIAAEKQFESIVNRAQQLDDKGNVPVVIHGANFFGVEFDKSIEENYRERLEKEAKGTGREVPKRIPRVITVVDSIRGQVMPLEFKEKYVLGEEKPELWTGERQLDSLNHTHWDQEKLKVFSQMKEMSEVEARQSMIAEQMKPYAELAQKNLLTRDEEMKMKNYMHNISVMKGHTDTINQHITSSIQDMYNTYVKSIDESKLDEQQRYIFEKEKQKLNDVGKNIKEIDKERTKISNKFRKGITDREAEELQRKHNELMSRKSELISNAISAMNIAPEVFKPVNEFSIEQASKTFSNVAFNAYKKFGDKAPIIAIENSYPNMPLSTAKDLKEAIEESRKKFVNLLVKEEKLSRDEAKKIASKLIGANWDVGHINMLRKSGYSEEEILEEAKKIAPFVKHMHLTDNFGYADTHLPPGMGNVPIKKTLEIMEKSGNLEGVRQIIEAGNFVQNFKESPYPYALEALGSPLYSMGGAPYWSQTRAVTMQDYYSVGFGEMLSEYHFKQFYGGGWSAVPRELGGEAKGSEKGRFAAGGE